ncbi:hypothetical protein [Enterococcus faecalis]|uniref:hypothetical protein n=1 Tax=Enterococcus faecalis TaxID=1351 RepID=UPI00115CFA05|nr:hypothetical protein [Enterococcus faecalis]EGO2793423.1 hypothetical protein [Enterococcus faecalis]NRC94912.1 hypothetical protein [Enterococcus faecalis]NSU41575.1 hypothetical protein [Enterococcus faecalis]NSV14953.1 hypothetical protein [Enterococcus faecalis]NSV28736.1 hypothetical protein [Enterococcus faecalis]
MKAIILCADLEKKMFPFDETYGIGQLPVLNKEISIWQVEQLLELGIKEKDIYIKLNFNEQQTINTLKRFTQLNFISSKEPLRLFLSDIVDELKSNIIFIQGNRLIAKSDLSRLVSTNTETRVLVSEKNRESIGMIGAQVNEHQQVEFFLAHAREHYVNTEVSGLYILTKEAVLSVIKSDDGFNQRISGSMIPDKLFIENALNDFIEQGNEVTATYAQDVVFSMEHPWDILKANEYYLKEAVSKLHQNEIEKDASISNRAIINGVVKLGKNSKIGDNVIVNGKVIIGDNVLIENGAILNGPILVGDNSYIRDYAKVEENTVLGVANKIGHNAEIKGVTMQGVSAIHYSEMYGVIGKYVDIAAACVCGILRFNDTPQTHKINGRIYSDSYSNAVFIGDYTRTGINNIFFPGVKVGSECALYPGLNIEKDVAHRKLIIKKEEHIEKEWGSHKYGW